MEEKRENDVDCENRQYKGVEKGEIGKETKVWVVTRKGVWKRCKTVKESGRERGEKKKVNGV